MGTLQINGSMCIHQKARARVRLKATKLRARSGLKAKSELASSLSMETHSSTGVAAIGS